MRLDIYLEGYGREGKKWKDFKTMEGSMREKFDNLFLSSHIYNLQILYLYLYFTEICLVRSLTKPLICQTPSEIFEKDEILLELLI